MGQRNRSTVCGQLAELVGGLGPAKALRSGVLDDAFGFAVEAPSELADDPTGDQIDALLCAMQAAWAWNRRDERYESPTPLKVPIKSLAFGSG